MKIIVQTVVFWNPHRYWKNLHGSIERTVDEHYMHIFPSVFCRQPWEHLFSSNIQCLFILFTFRGSAAEGPKVSTFTDTRISNGIAITGWFQSRKSFVNILRWGPVHTYTEKTLLFPDNYFPRKLTNIWFWLSRIQFAEWEADSDSREPLLSVYTRKFTDSDPFYLIHI